MFLRSVKARGRKEEKHGCLRLVESYREGGIKPGTQGCSGSAFGQPGADAAR